MLWVLKTPGGASVVAMMESTDPRQRDIPGFNADGSVFGSGLCNGDFVIVQLGHRVRTGTCVGRKSATLQAGPASARVGGRSPAPPISVARMVSTPGVYTPGPSPRAAS